MTGPERAHLRVVAGQPTAQEVAALTVALSLAARARAAAPPAPGGRPPVGGWAWRGRLLRSPLPRGPGAWRRSAHPG